MTEHWEAVHHGGDATVDDKPWAAVLRNEHGQDVRVHPIGFDTEREAERAVARLNVRDSGGDVEMYAPPADQAKAARQAARA